MFACVCVRVGQEPSIPAAVGGGGQRQNEDDRMQLDLEDHLLEAGFESGYI